MPASQDQVLEPAHGAAITILKGDILRITDLEGSQVSDLVVFSAGDTHERFSPGNTRKLNNSLLLSVGDTLYSTKCTPMLRIVTDTVARHDITSSWCNPYDYPIRFGVNDHPSCLAILTRALEPYGIEEYLIPEPFNVFMKTDIDEVTGHIEVMESPSRAEDYIEFQALSDCIVGMTVCPQDLNACNGWKITPLRLTVETQPQESQPIDEDH